MAAPLTEQEIYDLGVEHHEVVVGYELGDSVIAELHKNWGLE